MAYTCLHPLPSEDPKCGLIDVVLRKGETKHVTWGGRLCGSIGLGVQGSSRQAPCWPQGLEAQLLSAFVGPYWLPETHPVSKWRGVKSLSAVLFSFSARVFFPWDCLWVSVWGCTTEPFHRSHHILSFLFLYSVSCGWFSVFLFF